MVRVAYFNQAVKAFGEVPNLLIILVDRYTFHVHQILTFSVKMLSGKLKKSDSFEIPPNRQHHIFGEYWLSKWIIFLTLEKQVIDITSSEIKPRPFKWS